LAVRQTRAESEISSVIETTEIAGIEFRRFDHQRSRSPQPVASADLVQTCCGLKAIQAASRRIEAGGGLVEPLQVVRAGLLHTRDGGWFTVEERQADVSCGFVVAVGESKPRIDAGRDGVSNEHGRQWISGCEIAMDQRQMRANRGAILSELLNDAPYPP